MVVVPVEPVPPVTDELPLVDDVTPVVLDEGMGAEIVDDVDVTDELVVAEETAVVSVPVPVLFLAEQLLNSGKTAVSTARGKCFGAIGHITSLSERSQHAAIQLRSTDGHDGPTGPSYRTGNVVQLGTPSRSAGGPRDLAHKSTRSGRMARFGAAG